MELYIATEEDMLRTGEHLAHGMHQGAMVHLSGSRGSGKSTLMLGILHGFGLRAPKNQYSSNFISSYKADRTIIYCCDFYSLTEPEDPRFVTACEHLREAKSVRIIESPERAGNLLPEPDLHIKFRTGFKGRTLLINTKNRLGTKMIHALSARH